MPAKQNADGIKKLWILLWVLWMAVIFAYSAKTATQSTVQSNRVGKMLCSVFVSGYDEMPSEAQMRMAQSIDFFVRKSAHFLEYTVLGVLTVLSMGQIGVTRPRLFRNSIIWCILYAAGDELHQYFVPGRACKFSDVLLDSAGALFGIAVILLIKFIGKDRKGKKEE